jgi:polar amino acid transport system substrate-binding protein
MKTHNRSIFVIAFWALFFLILFSERGDSAALSWEDFVGKSIKFGVGAGDIFDSIVEEVFKSDNITYYSAMPDILAALRNGQIDAAISSNVYIDALSELELYGEFNYYPLPEDVYFYETANIFFSTRLRDEFNAWLAKLKASGELQKMLDFWMVGPFPAPETIPQYTFMGEKGTLRICDTGNYPPLVYLGTDGEYTGFDIDLTRRFCAENGYTPKFEMMAYDAIVPYITTGKADMSAATFVVTAERKDNVIFGDTAIVGRVVLITKKQPATEPSTSVVLANKTMADSPAWQDFAGKTLASQTGTITDDVAKEALGLGDSNIQHYDAITDSAMAVQQGKTDFTMYNKVVLEMMIKSGFGDCTIVDMPERYGRNFGAISTNQDLLDKYNAFLEKTKLDGVYDEMIKRWITDFDPANPSKMPEIPLTGQNGVLKAASYSGAIPFAFAIEGGVSGFDVEQLYRFADYLDMNLEITDYKFNEILTSVVSGKADIGLSGISITEERKKTMRFSDPYYFMPYAILYKPSKVENAVQSGESSFIARVKDSVYKNLIVENRWKLIAEGLFVTIEISLLSQILATLFAAVVCYLLTRKNRIVSSVANFYCALLARLPMLTLLLVSYYIIFRNSNVNPVLVAVCAFAMVSGTSIAGGFAGAMDTVDLTEIEAARAVGFGAFAAFRLIVFPQAIRRFLPSYMGGFIDLVKGTAIVGYIAIQDLARAGDVVRSRTFDAYFPILFSALIYLVITTVCIEIFKLVSKSQAAKRR